MTAPVRHARPRGARFARAQRGFTLMEVLVALLVFAISVVGLVAMESRSVESQKASAEIREGERIAQQWMSDLQSRSFEELLGEDFEGNIGPTFPYEDDETTASNRVVAFRRPPADIDYTVTPTDEDEVKAMAAGVAGKYVVYRSVDIIFDDLAPPSAPPVLPDELGLIQGMSMEVTVMWIDDTNPAFPPPATLPGGQTATATNLTPDLIDPNDTDFAPYVNSVTLRTIRINDVPTEIL